MGMGVREMREIFVRIVVTALVVGAMLSVGFAVDYSIGAVSFEPRRLWKWFKSGGQWS